MASATPAPIGDSRLASLLQAALGGRSVRSVARLAGCDHSHLSRAIQGRGRLSESTLIRVARALELDPSEAVLAAIHDRLPPEERRALGDRPEAESDNLAALYDSARELQRRTLPWHVKSATFDVAVSANGDAMFTRSLRDLRPNPLGPPQTHFVIHEAVFGQDSPLPNGSGLKFHSEAPVPIHRHTETQPGKIIHHFEFPGGWPPAAIGAMSFDMSVALPGAYVPPGSNRPPVRDATGRVIDGGLVDIWLPYFCEELNLSLSLGLRPASWRYEIFLGSASRPDAVAVPTSTVPAEHIVFSASGGAADLTVLQPLTAYSYRIAWRGPFEELK